MALKPELKSIKNNQHFRSRIPSIVFQHGNSSSNRTADNVTIDVDAVPLPLQQSPDLHGWSADLENFETNGRKGIHHQATRGS